MPCPPLRDLPNSGIEPRSPTLQADSLLSEPPGKPTVSSGKPSWVSQNKSHLDLEPFLLSFYHSCHFTCACVRDDYCLSSLGECKLHGERDHAKIRFLPPNFALSWASQAVLVVKNLPANAGDARDTGLIPELGRSPESSSWLETQHLKS